MVSPPSTWRCTVVGAYSSMRIYYSIKYMMLLTLWYLYFILCILKYWLNLIKCPVFSIYLKNKFFLKKTHLCMTFFSTFTSAHYWSWESASLFVSSADTWGDSYKHESVFIPAWSYQQQYSSANIWISIAPITVEESSNTHAPTFLSTFVNIYTQTLFHKSPRLAGFRKFYTFMHLLFC